MNSKSAIKQSPKNKSGLQLFFPTFDELSVFLMTWSFLLILLTDPISREQLSGDSMGIIIIIICAVALTSTYHVFNKGKKGEFTKQFMLYSAIMTTLFSGLFGGIYIIQKSTNILLIFPVMNLISICLMYILYDQGIINETWIDDRDTNIIEAIIGILILILTLRVCALHDIYWAITFSITVFYSTTGTSLVRKIMFIFQNIMRNNFQQKES